LYAFIYEALQYLLYLRLPLTQFYFLQSIHLVLESTDYKLNMQEETPGTTVGTCKLKTISRDKYLPQLCSQYVKGLNQVVYKGSILLRLAALDDFNAGITTPISLNYIIKCMKLARPGKAKFYQMKDKDNKIKPTDPYIQRLQAILEKHQALFDKMTTPAFKSAMAYRPLDYAAQELFTNIKVQVSEHYFRYQKKYLRERIRQHLQGYGYSELKKMQLRALAYRVHRAVNWDGTLVTFSDKHLTETAIARLMAPLQLLCTTIHHEIPEDLRFLTEEKLKWPKLLPDLVKSLHQMAGYLSSRGVPSFSPLPNLALRRRNMLLDRKFFSVIYNEWKKKKIPIKTFERDYEPYYEEMFSTHKIFRKKYRKNEVPKSYSTNGYAVSIIFSPKRKSRPIAPKSKVANISKRRASIGSNNGKKMRPSKQTEREEILAAASKKQKKSKISSESNKGKRKSKLSKETKEDDRSDIGNAPEDGLLPPGLYDADILRRTPQHMDKYHITAIDPGNKKMLNCITWQKKYGEEYCISKGYYNEISHITRNTKKINQWIQDNETVSTCYKNLSETCLRGGLLEPYLAYVSEQANFWDALWDFEFQERVAALKYDTFLHKKMAIARICREIIAKNGVKSGTKDKSRGKSNDKSTYKKYNPKNTSKDNTKAKSKGKSNSNKKDKSKDTPKKPTLIVFGKGNGKMTISNTRNSSSHGPIKQIALALSLLVPVILVDENNTSKKCNRCTSPLVFPKMDRREKFKKILRRDLKKQFNTHAAYLMEINKPGVRKKVEKLQKKFTRKVKAYGVCYCSKYRHTNLSGIRKRILWKRDMNSGRCLLKVAKGKVTGKPYLAFQRGGH
jgi:hypothetical protein